MSNFTQEQEDQWFQACRNDVGIATARDLLSKGFDPDARDSRGRSGLFLAARGSRRRETRQISNLLLDALEKKYANEPKILLKIVADKKLRFDASHDDIVERIAVIKLHASAATGVPEQWFSCCYSDESVPIVKEYLDHGFDPDTRDVFGNNGLYSAANGSHHRATREISDRTTREISALLLEALEKKYANDPARLLAALTDYPGKYSQDHADVAQKLQERIDALQSTLGLPVTSSAVSQSKPADHAVHLAPHSIAPAPLKLDRTLTATKLGQSNSSGQTNLTAIANQGRLGEVFTPEIWSGRREEMEEAWKKVPEAFHNQVNIEVVRGQLSQMTAREKFNVKDNSWGQGF